MTTIRIDTPRLIIRSPLAEDAGKVNAAIHASAEALRAWMPWADPLPTPAQTANTLGEAIAKTAADKDYWLLITTRNGDLVGSSGLHDVDWRIPGGEIGYWLDSRQTGQGYACEAVAAIAGFAREVMGLRRIQILVADANARSRRVVERLGFPLEAVLREHRINPGGRRDHTRIYASIAPDAVGQEPWAGLHRRAITAALT